MTDPGINIGVLIAHSPGADVDAMQALAGRLAADVEPMLCRDTGAVWHFHSEDPSRLHNDDGRRPSDFLDEASLRMVEGPYDAVVVITDVALVSHRQQVVSGLASPLGRVVVISLRRMLLTPRNEPMYRLDAEPVRWNAAALLIHLLGHLLGLRHSTDPDAAMAPFSFDPARRAVPSFGLSREQLQRRAARLPERRAVGLGPVQTLLFHLVSSIRHLDLVLDSLRRNRAPLLPLSLPALATAAVAPTLIVVFSAETWDVGLHMSDTVAWTFAGISIMAATVYLTLAQNLFFPHKEKRVNTEHLAVVNVTVFLTILLGVLGLFAMLVLLMLGIETLIFPPDLMRQWPSLENPVVTRWDTLRIAVFIGTIGVLTGALAGGLESRVLLRHLALFPSEP